ncbi:hypothetical protein [Shewanella sedimentimangrovi]|uniref:Uncharacterized protein n=1 Tax=Shewanella sedimentimangrovi TaxID=2814293 RepID=A0ABX7R1N7_9GAMM|nr:hypothetical protein [Shewanella sedimentimangrovi]QSX37105.1 hypothetical protein JYB85_17930 [Shewanella sedimentimangrovi]
MFHSTHLHRQLAKFMARPRRDPIEALQSSLYCRLISIRLNIPLSGPEFSYFFEATRRSSSKWQRIIEGSKTPSLGSRNQIAARILKLPQGEMFCQELRDFWDSPLWQAMASKPPSGNDWSTFYKRLPLALQRHVFTTKASTANPFERRFPRKAEVKAVEKQCEMSTLAFIMALIREVTFPRPSEYGLALELSLCRMLLAFFSMNPSILAG